MPIALEHPRTSAPPAAAAAPRAAVALRAARAKLNRRRRSRPIWPVLAAAAFAAVSALGLAFAVIVGPPL